MTASRNSLASASPATGHTNSDMGDKAEKMLSEFIPATAAAMTAGIGGAALAGGIGAGAAGAGAAGAGAAGGTGLDLALASGALPGGAELGGEAAMLAAPEVAGGTGLETALASGALPGGMELGGEAAMLAPYGGPTGMYASAGGAESSLYGPNVAAHPETALGGSQSSWLDKFKNPRTLMQIGQMVAQAGTKPKVQGGPMGSAFT